MVTEDLLEVMVDLHHQAMEPHLLLAMVHLHHQAMEPLLLLAMEHHHLLVMVLQMGTVRRKHPSSFRC